MAPRWYGGLVLALLLGGVAGQCLLRSERNQSFLMHNQTFVERDAIARAVEIQKQLMLDGCVSDWRATCELAPQKGDPGREELWVVSCNTANAAETRYLIDPVTRELIQFSRTPGAGESAARTPVKALQAVALAKSFVACLKPEPSGKPWRLHHVAPYRTGAWHVYLEREGLIAHIAIFSASGELMWFRMTSPSKEGKHQKANVSRTGTPGRQYSRGVVVY